MRVAAWNVERERHPLATAALVERTGADIVLLTEMDVGMARTGQRHTVAELAARLGATYAFGVEFVELGVGSARDRRLGAEGANANGLHGNAIVSRFGLSRPALVRLTDGALWFSADSPEPRVGGRMALLATVPFGDAATGLAVASVHLESSSTPGERDRELRVLLDALDDYAPRAPVVVGGDLNTFSASLEELARPGRWDELLAADPQRFVDPVRHEPLFETAAERGYQWSRANVSGPTTRPHVGSRAWRYMRLDWLLTRGLECRDAATYPAVDGEDLERPISDHDLVAVTVACGTLTGDA